MKTYLSNFNYAYTQMSNFKWNLSSFTNCKKCLQAVAYPGGGGARAPHWPVKYAKSHVFGAFEADFW